MSAILRFKDTASGKSTQGKSLFTRFVGWINSMLNPSHNWFDYEGMDNMVGSITNQVTQDNLTGAQQQMNSFNAAEAQKQRDWQEQMSNTAYQRQVVDMQKAGVNPALAMSNGAASTPSGSAASSTSPFGAGISFSDIMQLIMLPLQKKLVRSQAELASKQGTAAIINAQANEQNAVSNERQAGASERQAGAAEMNARTNQFRAEIEKSRVENINALNDAEKKRIAEQTALISLQREQLPAQLQIAKQNADSDSQRAIAALETAQAAVQNAATNDRLADYETSLKYTQELLTWYQAEGQKVVAQYMPEKAKVELDNMLKEGVKLDAQGRLINRQGHLVTAQTVKTYVNVGTDISGAINQWINPFSKGPGNSSAPGFDLSGAYQGVAYGYD